jgi:predicted metalloprotease
MCSGTDCLPIVSQKQAQGYVVPESFNRLSNEWNGSGVVLKAAGDFESCNTFGS